MRDCSTWTASRDLEVRRVDGLGTVVMRHRQELGLSREQLAVKAGVSSSLIQRIETAGHTPKFDRLTSIAAALGVSVGELIEEAAA